MADADSDNSTIKSILDSGVEGVKSGFNYSWEALSSYAKAAGGITGPITNDLSQSKYNFNYLVFPNDLGMDYYGHYMVININVPVKLDGTAAGKYSNQFEMLPNEYSKVDVLRFKGTDGNGAGALAGGDRSAFSLPRATRRIAESIALYMPAGLNFNSANDYEPVSLAEKAGRLLTGPVYDAYVFTTQLGRRPVNPGVDVMYLSTPLRNFRFMFMFAPRNKQESESLENIIRTLRFHMAPEINNDISGLGIGTTWIPPAEFDITFFNKGVENRNIPRINTCVLNAMEIDYAPEGGMFSAFVNGHPVRVVLQMDFLEIEPVHKQRVLQGIY